MNNELCVEDRPSNYHWGNSEALGAIPERIYFWDYSSFQVSRKYVLMAFCLNNCF